MKSCWERDNKKSAHVLSAQLVSSYGCYDLTLVMRAECCAADPIERGYIGIKRKGYEKLDNTQKITHKWNIRCQR